MLRWGGEAALMLPVNLQIQNKRNRKIIEQKHHGNNAALVPHTVGTMVDNLKHIAPGSSPKSRQFEEKSAVFETAKGKFTATTRAHYASLVHQ
jgi:hypothetical protein